MGSFQRKRVKEENSFRRLQGDMRVTMGAGEITYLQPVAQSKTDGKFYAYKKGDENVGVIAGLFTMKPCTESNTVEAEDGDIGTITTQVIIAKKDIVGIEWESDFTALSQLKLAGVIVVEQIEGTEEV